MDNKYRISKCKIIILDLTIIKEDKIMLRQTNQHSNILKISSVMIIKIEAENSTYYLMKKEVQIIAPV